MSQSIASRSVSSRSVTGIPVAGDSVFNRLDQCFSALKKANRSALITFVTAGDPDVQTSAAVLKALPGAGADIIELGMPFSDPSADGPIIAAASERAIEAGMTVQKTLEMVADFRMSDPQTPLVLMGYFNPVYAYGIDHFVAQAAKAGADGMIIVDLPPEEDEELRLPAKEHGLHLIRLATPTSTGDRLPSILENASGFLYYVAVAGITGQKSASQGDIAQAFNRLKSATDLPVAVGFGIKTPDQAKDVACLADGVVVGSALVDLIARDSGKELEDAQSKRTQVVNRVCDFVSDLKSGIVSARDEV